MSVYLSLDRIEIDYGGVKALHPLSLSIEQGEFFCLLGPSGCGKTTTLNVIAGFLSPSAGRILLEGQDVTDVATQQRRVGVVFQSYALFPHMTVADNIGYGLKMQKRDRAEIKRRVASLLDLIRLPGKEDRFPSQISGGEQQRVAIARALAIEPRLLLLDEPLSNLDARLREDMCEELKRIQRRAGVTTIFVTHNQEEAFSTGDRIAVLNQGRLEQVGTPTDIYRCPATSFVARFIGRSNRLRGQFCKATSTFQIEGHAFRCSLQSNAKAKNHLLFLRPEEVVLSREHSQVNSVPGTVSEVVFAGAVVNYRIATEVGELHACRLTGQDPIFSVGDPIQIGWAPQAGSLLSDEADD
ncbi:MAG: ABC transporter ATP-binding protein [Candidatus Acidiferrales bacterium]